ncbi:MAG: nucleotidyl transferase AbiEii/AbiGii toxin family protein [Candidatus Micrarchaeales archaeon]|jgi:predicted nucleotidyltransferase component of viral defense system|nr:nucleotidyl transferase AbiEii/AbiGii toxin family protein [Candidatus Micrarchaeales archaeon]
MITKEALAEYKTYKDPYQVEKDYLQDLLLYNIYANSSNEMVLKGGTAFAKFYSSDRFSEDLDFTLSESVQKPEEFAKSIIRKAVERLEYQHSYKEEPSINKFGTVSSVVLIGGPRFNGKESTMQQIRIEISTAGKLYLGSEAKPKNPAYADARPYVALVMKREEILGEKIRALMSRTRRHRERDLYDLYFFIGKGTSIDKGIIHEKLLEAKIDQSIEAFEKAIKDVSKTWSSLEPMVEHKLEDFSYVSNFVKGKILESSIF